ncbi:hypothetical protein ACFVAJ_11240 [Agromyces sp. NPDC057679]|uniref:hypothetical protein n=1 Tax=Agromyces sp. NPDC057679 TaxID=3346207 RepID=UPI00366A8C49
MTAVELPPLGYPADDEHEGNVQTWASGWSACLDWLWPMYVRANADADRLYRLAFPEPKHVVDARIGQAIEEAFFEEVEAR